MSKTNYDKIQQKKTQIEHILIRPDTQIGSVERDTRHMWILNSQNNFEQKSITQTPGLFKIFDEILVNAADNAARVNNLTEISVNIDQAANRISVSNDGDGIPVTMHTEHKLWIPEMIFGHLLTGSNFDDNEKKVVGGRNGYGAKLANIYSTSFTVECCDRKHKKSFYMNWVNNMQPNGEAKVEPFYDRKDNVKITFEPELKRFKMTKLDDDMVALFKKRVQDIAGFTGKKVKVMLNGERVPINDFKEQCGYQLKTNENLPKVFSVVNERWEVCLSLAPEGSFQHCSFVNGVCTQKGGTHVDKVLSIVVDFLQKQVAKDKNFKDTKLRPQVVKQNLWLFIKCQIENPTFDSQTKENMTLKQSAWGSKCELSEKTLKEICKSGLLEMTMNLMNAKGKNELSKIGGAKKVRLTGVKKLDDANNAGKKEGSQCTLILTEGDSAKALAVAGLGVVGREQYGVQPLRGKVMNVREATNEKVKNNEEISSILKIMGLTPNKPHNISELRQGSIMIMTDQDFDGSHIKGLLINFVHKQWPHLLKIRGFLREFITPVIKVFAKSNPKNNFAFYTMPEFEHWYRTTPDALKTFRIKQYKGLGTSTSAEAKEQFSDLKKHIVDFEWGNKCSDEDIELAFDKKKADDRKTWLGNLDQASTFIDTSRGVVSYNEFVHKELILFSNQTNQRSIPSSIDGLKPGQRKVIHTCLKMNQTAEIKVAQLSGKVAEKAAYHHGEVSLQDTIVKLAQNYPGSNNINLLAPVGQFGTRLMGGADSASARQIFTKMNHITKLIFKDEDKHVLSYCEDDGMVVEPEQFVPIIPMVLVNGAQGIGTGWSTSVPCQNPLDLIKSIRNLLDGQELDELTPWQRGFKGNIDQVDDKKQRTSGVYEKSKWDNDVIYISELPINKWTNDQKNDFLENNLSVKGGHIEEQFDDGDEHNIKLEVHTEEGAIDIIDKARGGLLNWFNLESDLNLTNMVLYNRARVINKYNSVNEILKEFYEVRLEFYRKRKEWMLKKLNQEKLLSLNKKNFIEKQLSGEISVHRKDEKTITTELRSHKFTGSKELNQLKDDLEKNLKSLVNEEDEDKEEKQVDKENDQDYLLSMPIKSFTNKKITELNNNYENYQKEIKILESKSEKDLWIADLNELEVAYKKFMNEFEKSISQIKANKSTRKVKKGKAIREKKNEVNKDKDKNNTSKPKPLPDPENQLKRKRDDMSSQMNLDMNFDLNINQNSQGKKPAPKRNLTSIKNKESVDVDDEEESQSVASDASVGGDVESLQEVDDEDMNDQIVKSMNNKARKARVIKDDDDEDQ